MEIAKKSNLIEILLKQPKILHIICHGNFNSSQFNLLIYSLSRFYLAFEKEIGELDECTSENIEAILNQFKDNSNLQLVFVNACFSE